MSDTILKLYRVAGDRRTAGYVLAIEKVSKIYVTLFAPSEADGVLQIKSDIEGVEVSDAKK